MRPYLIHILFLLMILHNDLFAQSMSRAMSLDEMVKLAMNNNPMIRNSGLYIEKSNFDKKTAWEPGPTVFDWTHGQINTIKDDDYFLILQDLGSPFSHASLAKLKNSQIRYYQILKDKTEKEIRRDIAIAYNDWLFYTTVELISSQTLEYLEKAADYSGLQYRSGESSLLSKMLTETKYLELVNYKKDLANRKSELENQLMKWTYSEDPVIPTDTGISVRDDSYIINKKDSAFYSPEIALSEQLVSIARSNIGFQKAGLTPTLKAGYFNQKIDHVSGFNGWQIGIGIPLWFFPQRSRIQMAMIDRSIAENQNDYQKRSTEFDLKTLYNKLQLLNDRIIFFETRMLTNAATIESNAIQLYESGEIGYIEYIQNIISVNKTREDYWTLVKDHNQIIFQIEYFIYE